MLMRENKVLKGGRKFQKEEMKFEFGCDCIWKPQPDQVWQRELIITPGGSRFCLPVNSQAKHRHTCINETCLQSKENRHSSGMLCRAERDSSNGSGVHSIQRRCWVCVLIQELLR